MSNRSIIPASPFAPIVEMVVNSLPSEHSRRSYGRSLTDFLTWYQETGQQGLTRAVVNKYLVHMREALSYSPPNINSHLTAVRKLAREAFLNGVLEAIHEQGIQQIGGLPIRGRRTGNWLTLSQAQELINAPGDATLRGLRDRAMLAAMIGCGLRRAEIALLSLSHIQQREGRWAIIDINGKRNKIRSIPMPPFAKAAINAWTVAAEITEGKVFRAINRGGHVVGDGLTPQAFHNMVAHYADLLGFENLAPHDLRRTFAKLSLKGGAKLEQISLSLGHASIRTTQEYLGVDQDFEDAPCDHLGLKLGA
jgi:site-specific recombinase XerD